jgi:CRP/FNR family transcriptional regulator, anaerobic regulatory protein
MFEDVVRQLPPIEDKTYLYRQDDKFNNLYIVRSGCVKQVISTRDGIEQIIGFSLPGEMLGLDAIATGRYSESTVVLKTATVCELDYEEFEELCEKIPGLAKQILKMASKELIDEYDLRLAISTKNSEEKLAVFLSSLSTRLQLLGYSPYNFELPMGRSDIGNYLGMAPETISRTVKKLIQRGLIEADMRSVIIKDRDELKVLAGHCDVCPSLNIANAK